VLVIYKKTYGVVSTFEHGKIGQTVFHAHTHIVPYDGSVRQIIPEGEKYITDITGLEKLREVFARDGQYLFFSIGERKMLVDKKLGQPRFFRDRFALAFGNSERGNWKTMQINADLMQTAHQEIARVKDTWKKFYSN
jgi:hypothetical protein